MWAGPCRFRMSMTAPKRPSSSSTTTWPARATLWTPSPPSPRHLSGAATSPIAACNYSTRARARLSAAGFRPTNCPWTRRHWGCCVSSAAQSARLGAELPFADACTHGQRQLQCARDPHDLAETQCPSELQLQPDTHARVPELPGSRKQHQRTWTKPDARAHPELDETIHPRYARVLEP